MGVVDGVWDTPCEASERSTMAGAGINGEPGAGLQPRG
jgi:hypothetical protein